MRDARELFEQRVEHAETVDEGKAKVNAREGRVPRLNFQNIKISILARERQSGLRRQGGLHPQTSATRNASVSWRFPDLRIRPFYDADKAGQGDSLSVSLA